MKNAINTNLGIDFYNKINSIQVKLRLNGFCVRNTDIHNLVGKMLDENFVIEKFKKIKKKKVDNLINNPFFELKW